MGEPTVDQLLKLGEAEIERLADVARQAWLDEPPGDDAWPAVVRAVLGDPRIHHALSYYANRVGFLGGRVS